MRKKIIAGLLLSTMIFSLTACGSNTDKKENDIVSTQADSEEPEIISEVETSTESDENSFEKVLEMSDEELLAFSKNDWTDVCIMKTDGGAVYGGEFTVVGINKNGTDRIAPNVYIEAEYSYQMFVFPTNVTGLVERQAEKDNQKASNTGSTVKAVGKQSDNKKIYYGDGDSNYSFLSAMEGIRLYVLPSPIEKIYDSAFSGAKDIERVVLSDSMIYIGYNAFANCTNLKKINLPSSITEIEHNAFTGCPNLVAVVDEGSYAEAFCKKNNITIEYSGKTFDTGYGISQYELEQLEQWKRVIIQDIAEDFYENKDDYLFDLLFVYEFDNKSKQGYRPILACWDKNSGDFNKNVEIYLDGDIEYSADPDCINREIYVCKDEFELLEVTERYNNEEIPTEIWYNLLSYTDGKSYGSKYYYEDGTDAGTRNYYDYIMEKFDIDSATKLTQDDFVSYDEILKEIIEK